jgi:hypothetical protein
MTSFSEGSSGTKEPSEKILLTLPSSRKCFFKEETFSGGEGAFKKSLAKFLDIHQEETPVMKPFLCQNRSVNF